jgi:hypothetical protein
VIVERTNETMRRLLPHLDRDAILDPALSTVLKAGFERHDGCVFLAAEMDRRTAADDRLDRTGREALINHIHIADRLQTRENMAEQGRLYAVALAAQLADACPGGRFTVVMSVGDDCVVRSYMRRPNEIPWISDDLEGYLDEAVLALAVG